MSNQDIEKQTFENYLYAVFPSENFTVNKCHREEGFDFQVAPTIPQGLNNSGPNSNWFLENSKENILNMMRDSNQSGGRLATPFVISNDQDLQRQLQLLSGKIPVSSKSPDPSSSHARHGSKTSTVSSSSKGTGTGTGTGTRMLNLFSNARTSGNNQKPYIDPNKIDVSPLNMKQLYSYMKNNPERKNTNEILNFITQSIVPLLIRWKNTTKQTNKNQLDQLVDGLNNLIRDLASQLTEYINRDRNIMNDIQDILYQPEYKPTALEPLRKVFMNHGGESSSTIGTVSSKKNSTRGKNKQTTSVAGSSDYQEYIEFYKIKMTNSSMQQLDDHIREKGGEYTDGILTMIDKIQHTQDNKQKKMFIKNLVLKLNQYINNYAWGNLITHGHDRKTVKKEIQTLTRDIQNILYQDKYKPNRTSL